MLRQVAGIAEFFKKLKVRVILSAAVHGIITVLYSHFIADTVFTKITDAQMTKVDGRFMIAKEYRTVVNDDAR